MFFIKNKKKGNTLIFSMFLLFLLSYLLSGTFFILRKEYEKCYILTKSKKINSNIIVKKLYRDYIEKIGGVKYISYKKDEPIWLENINDNEKTNNGYIITKIIKNNKVIYDFRINNKKNYRSLIKNYSDYNKKNEIKVIFMKKYLHNFIGGKELGKIELSIVIKSSYFYDKDLNIKKNLKAKLGAVNVN